MARSKFPTVPVLGALAVVGLVVLAKRSSTKGAAKAYASQLDAALTQNGPADALAAREAGTPIIHRGTSFIGPGGDNYTALGEPSGGVVQAQNVRTSAESAVSLSEIVHVRGT